MWRQLTVLSVYGAVLLGTRLAIRNWADAGSPDVTFVVYKASTGIGAEACRCATRRTNAHGHCRR
jgi:hypothetical protein